MTTIFDARLFAAAISTRRGGLSLRDVAVATGVSAATLSRLEHGEIPDLDTFLHQDQVRDTMQLVEKILHEDGVLAPEIIDAFLVLLRMVRMPGGKGL